ncbi:beta-1,4 N-acetylgalactosaminyltransferase 2 [Mus musculus]|uniref:Beta-1,4 N-acetylgalactosaminyltransferase 2 n=4 Tax=Mus TaxID=862507 RepID=B4GN2_MOUSE|nr:beta-1,4 N-acetylgalactosaminyltransferase 2 [Mus musculus]Q09199.1 RecName: Full=Beta-1,4 N-acetylgalactosaminyltransferase 2 [Mus musculus]AEJ22869.1 beta-1,4 N-acetylgalactosaminyltransferase 2 [Mus spretus]AEJ22873.1 beta-1,4 N-acetylgalactosaminyltransferase 2 [Mus musculus domesticus]AAA39802.1 N-acetylgalactosaminyltransferase [Mus musculus]AAI39166.1 Beta-1,4-N-acetyl-galactosaminyl transferase 2 [Mus musculus]AAI39167.1 Beta-1,4-N-acetyl-galactosaminyl transferase 2 [Mus musculus]|eukprot:NP_032107.1 beta-1,4 N-acetylgalactosaminyltransferase 2 [Mus musculus]
MTSSVSFASFRFPWLLKTFVLMVGLATVAFMVRKVSLTTDFSTFKPKFPEPARVDPVLKLLPEEHLRKLFTYSDIWLFPKNQCDCNSGKLRMKYKFQDAYNQKDLPAVNARRQAEFEHFQRREGLPRPPPLLAPPNLPFGYPVHGVEVMPLHTILIPGLQYEGPDAPVYEVILKASLGTLNTLADVPDDEVQGRGQRQLTISTRHRKVLNFILQHVTYTSTEYYLHKVDTVSMEYESSVAKFPVTIKQQTVPKLYDPGPERKIRNLVTIATKTFLRPHKLKILLQSIRKYYPDITVIVADDSKEPLEINDDYVEYYTMPFGKGWFAGRNLAISQVTTKYVLWVDDDFLFSDKTKIEVLVDVLEKTELDVVGGSVQGNTYQFRLLYEQTKNGSCLHQRWGSFQALDGFPGCTLTSGVVNFFLAHTEQLRRVGFDPILQRVAHGEFFIDGLGRLLVGSCPGVIINHQVRTPPKDPKLAALEKTYDKYRANTNSVIQFKVALQYFKNHLYCST